MTNRLRPLLYVAGAILCATIWLRVFHDPAVARTALQVQQDKRDDSTHRANEVWKADFLKRDTPRDDSLRKLNAGIRGARGEIARLRRVTKLVTDSTPRDTLLAQLALRDTIITGLETINARLETAVVMLCAPLDSIAAASLGPLRCAPGSAVGQRDTLVAKREREVTALTLARNIWRGQAKRKLGCAGGPSVTASLDGRVSAGFGATCGLRF